MNQSNVLLEVENLSKVFKKKNNSFEALVSVDLRLTKGEILGIIGESGSGKSTLLKIIVGLLTPTIGKVVLLGKDITGYRGERSKYIYQNIQMVFQNPIGSFNPRRTLRDSILENIRQLCPQLPKQEHNNKIDYLLDKVGILPDLVNRYPHSLSGGQCQRVAIARALAVEPKILLCDEVTSALDVSAQASVMNLLSKLTKEMGISIIFVSHDLSLAYHLCDRIMVMNKGVCVESGKTKEIFNNPSNQYTRVLVESAVDPISLLSSRKELRTFKI